MKSLYLLLPLALAGFVLAIAAPDASAKAFKAGMVDPGVTCSGNPADSNNTPCVIYNVVVSNSVAFQPCTTPPIPSGVIPAGPPSYQNCLWMYNGTGTGLTTFDFHIPLPIDFEAGDTLDCLTISAAAGDPTLTPTAGCDQTFAASDSFFDISFTADTEVKANAGFFLLMNFDGRLAPDAAGVIVNKSVSVPEPGELGLFGLGLLGIGLAYSWKKRRDSRGIHSAA